MDPVSILLSVIVFLVLVNVFNNMKKDKYSNFPPGPKPLPIIGNMHMINTQKPHKSFLELSKKYGKVFSIQLGQEKLVILSGYEMVKDALMNYGEEFSGRPNSPIISMTSNGHGVLFSHGENWKVMRKFTLSTLRDYGMGKKSIENKISEECENLMQTFRSYGGKPFNDQAIINTAVANIIVSILLDHRFEYDDPIILKLMNLINENIIIMESFMVKLFNSYPTLIGWLPGSHRKLAENFRELQDFVTATFTKQRKDFDVNNQRNFIDAFLAKQQEEKPESKSYYHNNNLSILMIDLFSAGMETTSTTLRWGLLLMMKYPEVQKKVQKEIESVIGSAQPQAEHRKQMPYTDAVIHEIQRFGDIVPGNLPHATIRDMTFRGYLLPKDTIVIPLLHSVLKDGMYFEKPDEFYPEHFLDSEGNFKKNEAFIPFSLALEADALEEGNMYKYKDLSYSDKGQVVKCRRLGQSVCKTIGLVGCSWYAVGKTTGDWGLAHTVGKRSCAGENLAKMELFLFFTTLLQNFTFQAPPGAELDLNPAVGFTNAPLPHEICAIPRR